MKIAVVAPSCRLSPDAAGKVAQIAAARGIDLAISPQCFLSEGHFAGPDSVRLAALLDALADDRVDAVWCARGGYGSNRIAGQAMRTLPPAAGSKLLMGYSDAGFLLAGLHRAGMAVAHGPMVQDILRDGGEAAITRALDWLQNRDERALEPSSRGRPAMAFNLTVLSNLLGTELEPDFSGVELLIEDVSEHDYRVDRAMFHVTQSANVRRSAGIRLGRFSDTPPNDPHFGEDAHAIVKGWCEKADIPFLGHADIGHDARNCVVSFPLPAN